jgi:hypothetical protein
MRKWITMLVAGGLIVAGAAVAIAQTDDVEPPTTPIGHGPAGMLGDVLSDLVAANTISQSQADAILGALDAKRAEFQEAREEMRAQRQEAREAMEEAWSDGVLTRDEVTDLPFADRLTDPEGPFADAWADGELTREEFDAVRSELGPRSGFGPGGGFGHHGFGHHGFGHHGFGGGFGPATESDTSLDA